MSFTPKMLITAHERVYGTANNPRSESSARRTWRALMLSWFTRSAADPSQCIENFIVEGTGPVCAQMAQAAYDVRQWNLLAAGARAGTLCADVDGDAVHVARPIISTESQSQFETVQWHVMWLRLEDQMPNEPVIMHRIVVWQSVWAEEYVPDMEWWGTAAPLRYNRWDQLRKPALEQLSVEFFGDLAAADVDDFRLSAAQRALKLSEGGFGVPITTLSLKQRSKHSNFAMCDGCAEAKRKWGEFRTRKNRTLGDVEAVKREVFAHIYEVKQERQFAMQMHQECAQRQGWAYEYDDKCGSDFLYLPSPAGGRHVAKHAGVFSPHRPHRISVASIPVLTCCHWCTGRYQYRFSMQANIFAGDLLRLSLVPPCLKTGVNFVEYTLYTPCSLYCLLRHVADSGPRRFSERCFLFTGSLASPLPSGCADPSAAARDTGGKSAPDFLMRRFLNARE